MRARTWIAALLACLPLTAWGAGAELNVVKSLRLTSDGRGAQLRIAGSKAPTFTVFKLTSPTRLVVDLAGADVSAVREPLEGQGPVAGVAVSQFSDERATVGRVIVALAEEARYDVRAAGSDVLITLESGQATETASAAAAAPSLLVEPAREVSGPTAEAPAPPSAPAAANAPADDVLNRRLDERTVAHPGHRVNGLQVTHQAGQLVLKVQADGEIGTFEVVELGNPPRLALDLFGFDKGLKPQSLGTDEAVQQVRFGKHDGKVRMVLDAGHLDKLPSYRIERTGRGLKIALGGEAVAAKGSTRATKPSAPVPAEPAAPAIPAAPAATPAKTVAVRDVNFKGNASSGKIVVALPKQVQYQVARPDPRTAVLTLSGASLPKRLERSLDTSAFGGPVKMVSSFAAPGQDGAVQIVATLEGTAEDSLKFDGGQLVWAFTAAPSTAEASATRPAEMTIDGRPVELQEEASSAPRAGAFSAEAANYASASGARKARYNGRRVSFEFKDIEIHNLLRIIAEVSKRNVVVADNVGGKVTIRLRNVPWDQALDLILKTKGLGKEEMGNIIRIAPLKDLEEEGKIAAARASDAQKTEPLKVRLIPVNYAVAAELSPKVKDVLSDRGTINVDQRTNVIIVKDTMEALARAEGLVRRLDTQTPQVLIEGRIVEANTNLQREVGIQWGGGVDMTPSTGNPTGLVFPSSVRMVGGSKGTSEASMGENPQFAVNMPAPVGQNGGGAIGFQFGSAGGAVALNLRLSALENTGEVKTISAPKVTTLDNKEATISQGISIPFSQVSASGVNTTFIEAKLELKVTPHVTSDGSVLMSINATNNQPDTSMTGSNGQPSISKKEAQTQVLVKDGDTTVIGGIYTRMTGENWAEVPLFSKIPVLGWLFKKNRTSDTRTELLIFITPRIVNRSQIVAASEGVSP